MDCQHEMITVYGGDLWDKEFCKKCKGNVSAILKMPKEFYGMNADRQKEILNIVGAVTNTEFK